MEPPSAVRAELVVALYGRSLMLAGVRQRLSRFPDLRVVAVDDVAADAIGSHAPDVLIVDLGVLTVESALALVRDRPDLLLVGVEASGTRLLVLSGAQASSIGTDELIALIRRGEGRAEQRVQGE